MGSLGKKDNTELLCTILVNFPAELLTEKSLHCHGNTSLVQISMDERMSGSLMGDGGNACLKHADRMAYV